MRSAKLCVPSGCCAEKGGQRLKAKNVFISPIYAVLPDINDFSADFILCSSEQDIGKIVQSNVFALDFLDTIEVINAMKFKHYHADMIKTFLSRKGANEDLFVCCDSGVSRSPAIAAAIQLYIGEDDMYI